MTVYYGTQMTKIDSVAATPAPGFVHGNVRCFAETVTFVTQTTGDTVEVGLLPKGTVFLYGVLNVDTSTSTATVSVGHTSSTVKYRAALAKTTTVPEVFGVTAATNTAETADRTVFLTIGTASLPTSGSAVITLIYALD